MNPIDRLQKLFSRFPGIGARQSRRFVYFLLHSEPSYLEELVNELKTIRKKVAQCPECFRFYENDGHDLCDICESSKTEGAYLMVVEKDGDIEPIRRSKLYKGYFFVLGGLVPVVERETPERIRVNELKKCIEMRAKKNGLKEIILAFSLNPSGEHTDVYVREILRLIAKSNHLIISSLGRGLSTGSELEYADNDTIKSALENRK